ncbi:hypothetical protein [Streptomyces sp. NBC_00005]|uniref:hypothetical protein n=1 Tax=Streptomyces sp. NBC_00005 TaxID=2903609 RepID=UPI00324E25CA
MDIAVVVGIPPQRLEVVLADRSSIRSGSARLIPLLACVDPDLDSTHRRISPLPNPFSVPGLAGYRLVATAMRLRFELPPG